MALVAMACSAMRGKQRRLMCNVPGIGHVRAKAANEKSFLSIRLRRYGLIALAFLHIGVGRGSARHLRCFLCGYGDAFGWSRAA